MPEKFDVIPENEKNNITQGEEKNVFARNESALDNISFDSDAPVFPEGRALEDTSLGFDVVKEPEKKDKKNEKAEPRVIVKKRVVNEKGVGVRSLAFTTVYVMLVLILAFLLAHFIITRGNDALAFSKSVDATVEITNENMTLDELADLLYEEGVIKYPGFFKFYVKVKNGGEFGVKKGTYTFYCDPKSDDPEERKTYNYDVILSNINPRPPRETITITIPEGFTTDDIIDLFVSKGIGTKEGFVDAINNAEFNYWFLEPLKEGTHEERFYRLDGYLYPDTYYFYTNSSEEAVLKKLLSNFGAKFAKVYQARCDELGITVDQALILASIIQCEAKYAADYEYVSSVLHNRLKDKKNYPKFECDVTLQYYFRHVEGARHAEITAADLALESQYNSRKYPGYTPGPICSPSLTAIKAALYPASTKFTFFISKSNGYLVYSENYAQHNKYLAMTPEELLKVDQGLYGDD